jgi:hypothetical protein
VRLVLIGTVAAFAGLLHSPASSGTAPIEWPPEVAGHTVKHGRATLRLRCTHSTPCVGTVTLGLGAARYRIPAGRTVRVRLRAPRHAKLAFRTPSEPWVFVRRPTQPALRYTNGY